ncbi:unnamed protein product [Sphagnum troendelagicum]|uniref:Uncharacterized protein n=1 Tax=Sphagnum jensenii TaxID=128206 RepID=A0ABP0VBC9_9BRYO
MGESLTEQCRVESAVKSQGSTLDRRWKLPSWSTTAGDKPEEGEDDVKSACPLRPGRHTCYNGRDKGSRPREGKLTSKTRPQFGLQAATRLHEAGIASNRRSAIRR